MTNEGIYLQIGKSPPRNANEVRLDCSPTRADFGSCRTLPPHVRRLNTIFSSAPALTVLPINRLAAATVDLLQDSYDVTCRSASLQLCSNRLVLAETTNAPQDVEMLFSLLQWAQKQEH